MYNFLLPNRLYNPVFSGVVTVPAGTVGAPGLVSTASATSGLYFSSTTVLFASNGANVGKFSAGGIWALGPSANTNADTVLTVGGACPVNGGGSTPMRISAVIQATATSGAQYLSIEPATAAAAFTCGYSLGLFVQPFSKGAGSTITRTVGFYMTDDSAGTNNAIIANNLSFSGNYFINYNGSAASSIGGQVRMASLGVGNSASATVAVGVLANKIEVFNASGVSLGFLPVYATIT